MEILEFVIRKGYLQQHRLLYYILKSQNNLLETKPVKPVYSGAYGK
jgi:hypothetical protein